MSNKPQSASARPEDLPTPDGLDLQPAVHLAMDLEEVEEATRRREPAVDLPLADSEEQDTEDLDEDEGFVLLDQGGVPVPGVSATPMPQTDRNIDPSPGEAALRDWRLRAPSRKAEALESDRQQSLVRTIQGSAALMALLLVTAVLGNHWWRQHRATQPAVTVPVASAPIAAPEALVSPSPVAPPPQAEPSQPKEVAPAAPAPAAPSADSLVQETLRHWTGKDGHLYWQWDYVGAEPLDLQWRDAGGALRMQDRVCDGRIDAETGRCYVGRSNARFQMELDKGAAPGTWTLESCLHGECSVVSTFEMPAGA